MFSASFYYSGGWSSRALDKTQWIQVEFTTPYIITAIQTQGRSDLTLTQWVKSYKVRYWSHKISPRLYKDDDGLDKVEHTCFILFHYFLFLRVHIYVYIFVNFLVKVFEANDDRDTVVTNYLEPPIKGARFLRIEPQEWHQHISLRFEILGCEDKGEKKKIKSWRYQITSSIYYIALHSII